MTDDALALATGGIAGAQGKVLAQASATETIRNEFGKGVKASTELLSHYSDGLDGAQMKILAKGGVVTSKDSHGREYTFDTTTIGGELHEAAAIKFMETTNYEGYAEFAKYVADHQNQGFKAINADVMQAAQKQFLQKAPFFGGSSLEILGQGTGTSAEGFARMITSTIIGKKLEQNKIATADPKALEDILKTIDDYDKNRNNVRGVVGIDKAVEFEQQVEELVANARDALTNPRLESIITPGVAEMLTDIAGIRRINGKKQGNGRRSDDDKYPDSNTAP